jgi:Zn-dependent protease with chaperone function
MQRLRRGGVAFLVVLALASGVAEGQTQIKSGWNMFSPQQDVEIGQQSAVAAEQQLPLVRDADVDAWVNRIGQKLAANAGGPQFQYRFRVVNASDINAFALPGGFIYLNRGIIENAKTEGEVAGVLAHEIAHASLRHGTQQATKAYAAQAGLQILGGLLGGRVGNNTAQILNTIGGVGLNALFLKFTREMETEADVRGAQILAASGYTPADMVSFFRQLEKVDKSRKTTWLSHHPAPPDRIARIEKERQLLREPASPTTNTVQLARIQSDLRGLGSAPTMAQIAQGTTSARSQGNPPMTSGTTSSVGRVAAPSSSFRTHSNRSGAYKVAYPSNWRVFENGGFGVTIAPEGGIGTVNGRTEVVYGLIVNHYDPAANARGRVTLDSAASDLVEQIRRASPHLRVVSGSAQQLRLEGRTALAATLRGRNPNTRLDERVTLVTRALPDGHLIYMLFVTPERDASRYSNVVNRIVQSIDVAEGRGH